MFFGGVGVGTRGGDVGEEERRVVNRLFTRSHAMSIHLNLLTVIATVWHGIRIGSKINF